MPQYSDGTEINKAEWDRLIRTTPTDYTIFYDSDDAKYYAECNLKNGTDYNGTDAGTIIQQAVTALGDNGGKIHIRGRKDITINDTITIGGCSLIIEGNVWGAAGAYTPGTILNLNASTLNKPMFKFTAASHKYLCIIKDMEIRGTNQTGSVGIQIESPYSDVWINRCYINAFGAAGIKIRAPAGANTWNHWITDNLIENSTGYGIWLTDAAHIITAHIDRIYMRGNYFYNNQQAIRCDTENTLSLEISGNHCDKSLKEEIYLTGCRSGRIIGNKILDNGSSAANTYYAIFIGGAGLTYPPNNIIIANNVMGRHLTSDPKGCIHLSDDCTAINISHNIFQGLATAAIHRTTTGTRLIRHNTGFVTENSGTATIANGTSSIQTAHSLAGTPTIVIATGRDTETDEVRCSARDATNITLAVPANVTADRIVDWYAEYNP